ncbi:MAG: ribosomal L7Ae/L30e/S12e/Gadd45 family protein [Acidaminococcus sp.]|jgi:large subunit ribosomal protein L7A|nr:ribosomal L7Ae/L30e/S12e/Gadd45 family protein [Acidaminococcus sp.]MCI2115437.1 ribosomal L7Ae/L30e/S12e/Gadd45 family protein [Acidaminococcus sp.]MCI2117541.1 ribosomal L7Ae/L30e/S12e/Gadd45 family protein [Acidaminococcus sp.]
MLLEQVKKGAPAVAGIKQTQKAIVRNQAVGVLLAEDADEHVTAPIRSLCESRGIPVETVVTMQELGKTCGIHVGAAVAAVLSSR